MCRVVHLTFGPARNFPPVIASALCVAVVILVASSPPTVAAALLPHCYLPARCPPSWWRIVVSPPLVLWLGKHSGAGWLPIVLVILVATNRGGGASSGALVDLCQSRRIIQLRCRVAAVAANEGNDDPSFINPSLSAVAALLLANRRTAPSNNVSLMSLY